MLDTFWVEGFEIWLMSPSLHWKFCLVMGRWSLQSPYHLLVEVSDIKLVKISGFDAYLDLKKQRYKCRHCDRTFTLETSLVNPNCFISTPVKQAIFLEASHKKSETDIARELNVSHSTVNRVIHSSYEEQPLPFNSLPKVLCFDEFKSVKSAEGHLPCEACILHW